MDIRLVCSDIDGTLLQYGKKELEGEIFDQIRALHQRGIWFCPASGRQYTSLRKLFAPVADCCVFICENGGTIFKEEQCIAKTFLGSSHERCHILKRGIRKICRIKKICMAKYSCFYEK